MGLRIEALHSRLLAGLTALALLGAIVVVSADSSRAETPVAEVTWSSEDGQYAVTARPDLPLAATGSAVPDTLIDVDPGAEYQRVFGQGQSLESSSVWNIARLSPAKKEEVLQSLFSPTTGNGYDLIRLSLGCADFCSEEFYTYNDTPPGQTDESLSGFSIQKDIDAGIISIAQRAREINPGVRFYLSMWSAPAWMKTNGSLINGGFVKPEYYDELARYQRLAIQAYESHGVPIAAITPQNEPRVIINYPTGEWTGEQMRDYIKGHLGPELERAGLGTQIWVGDDNPPRLRDFVPPILDDPASAQYVDGVAIHDYSGDDPSVLSEFALRYPGMPIHLTERSYYGINGEANKVDGNWQAGLRRVMELYRNGLQSWTYWLSFLDTTGEPNTGPLRAECCSLPFTVPAGNLDSVTANRDYYLYGQLSRFVRAGAVRIGSSQTSTDISNVAFRNPDGTIVVVVANGAASSRTVALRSPDGVVTDTLPAMTVGTYRWDSSVTQTDERLGTFQLVNKAYPDLAVQNTRDAYLANPDATHAVATPSAWNTIEQQWVITSAGDGYYRLTSLSSPTRVLHTTGENYAGWSTVWNVAAVSSSLGWDEQLWQIVPSGDGYYRLLNKARGTALQVTGERYGSWPNVHPLASGPASWNIPEQQFRLVGG
ncbi:glycoside hydrolase family 30 beta sandwich domain-containing protein [Microbacterium sp. RU33B]|uniref:glycoside hydrolase family 30 beta sandwich domain-containing protein n=1 Tax=Microbacterium sp. RU33B TaxID=1907390 RepID=UPI0009636801|nr:RICIN domain-containing protein [Microbacterium sp. RU33B]SIT83536.1 glucosylceramidase [Microbacterium sp. RU33B]